MSFIKPKISVNPAVKRKRSIAQDRPFKSWTAMNSKSMSPALLKVLMNYSMKKDASNPTILNVREDKSFSRVSHDNRMSRLRLKDRKGHPRPRRRAPDKTEYSRRVPAARPLLRR